MGQIGLSKQCRPRSDCSSWSSLIRVFSVCYSACIFWTHYCTVKSNCSNFRTVTVIILCVPIFRIFTVFLNENQLYFRNFFLYFLFFFPLILTVLLCQNFQLKISPSLPSVIFYSKKNLEVLQLCQYISFPFLSFVRKPNEMWNLYF